MNWKLLLISLSLVVGILSRPPSDEKPLLISEETTTSKTVAETTNLTEKPSTEALIATTLATLKQKTPDAPTTPRHESKRHDIIISEKQVTDENRELKSSSNLQLTSTNGVGSEITLKESFHHGVAVPMTLEEYEKELAREKELINKAKKKIAMESSTPKEGISTWILLSGSNDLTTTVRPETVKPTYRIESVEKKPVKVNSTTTKKRIPITSSPKATTKPTKKVDNNKLLTRIKTTPQNAEKNEEPLSTVAPTTTTTKKTYQTTKKKVTTTRPKPTTTTSRTTTISTTSLSTTEAPEKIKEEQIVIDDEKDEIQGSSTTTEPSTFLIMEAKESEFNLPDDRSPAKVSPTKKSSVKSTVSKIKKKKTAISASTTVAPGSLTNSTSIKVKKIKNKSASTKLASKKPEKPISTQIYNFLAREVMPSVGVGLVGLVVTAGLATYFLGGPLTALRRSYDIAANRRDDVAFDRSDDFGNAQDEGEMFGKVIAGMPENSVYRNNIRVDSYRQRVGQPQPQAQAQYNSYPQFAQQKYQAQLAQQQQAQYLRYRNADPYYNSYPQQNYAQQPQQPQPYYQQVQAKSNDYEAAQNIQAVSENTQKFNIDSVDMTTSEPSSSSYQMDYDEIAQSYFPQREEQQVSIEQQKIHEIETQKPQSELRSNEKVTIVNAQSVPANHKTNNNEDPLPQPEALTMVNSDEEYQNSIANAILNQQSQRKQFVVGSVIAENFEESPASIVPEHGPRRRRRRDTQKAGKSLEDNEIERDDNGTVEEIIQSEITTERNEKETSETTTPTYNISNSENNIFQLFRRIVDLKLRLGINFLQNATLAFQQYLRGVEQRMAESPLFNPYANNTNSTKSEQKKVEAL